MSIDASDFLPAELSTHTTLIPPVVGGEPDPLSQPETDPSIVLDIDASTAIDLVRAALSADFTDNRARWTHLVANLLTDIHNSLRATLLAHPVSSFRHLLPHEQSNLDSIKNAIDSLDDFFSDCQTSPNDWTTCMRCVERHHLPIAEDDWIANVINCQHVIQAARETVINEGIRTTNLEVSAWLAGQRLTAQDVALTNLISANPPNITDLISDPRVIEWSDRLKEAMKQHLDGLISEEASTLLTPSIKTQLDAHRAELLEEARAEARQEGQRLFHAQLQSQQSAALAEAQEAFTQWKADIDAEFSDKREAAREGSLRDLAAHKHILTIEAEEQKEQARLESIKGVDRSKAAFAHVGRKGRKPDPMGPRPSRSVSRSRADPPSPSPSSPIALDKTPTKADFAVGMTVDEDASSSVAGGLTNPTLDAQSVGATACVGRMGPPLGVGDGSPTGPLREDQRPVEDHTADASPGEALTSNNGDAAPLSHLPNDISQVTAPPSNTQVAPAKAESDDERLMHLIGTSMGMALKPLRDDVSRLTLDVGHLTRCVDFIESADDSPPGDVGAADPANWGGDGIDTNLLSYDAHIPADPSYWADRTANEDDAVMTGLYDDIGGVEAYEAKCNEGPHDWFFHIYTMENNLVSGSALTESQRLHVFDLRDLWWDFCHESHLSEILPPPDSIAHAFWQYRQNILAARSMTSRVALNNLTYGNGREPAPVPVPPSARPTPAPTLPPSRVPVSDHARDRARPSVAQKALPPVTSLGDVARDPITLSSSDDSSPPPATAPWTVVGGKSGRSYAKVAAKPTVASSTSPPTIRQAQAGSITAEQLNAMTKTQVVNAFNLRFSPRITASRHSKDGVIAAYLNRASRPVTATTPPPAPKPIRKTEYTLIRDPRAGSVAGLSGRCGDAADLV